MTKEITIIILCASAALLGFANYKSRQPNDIDKPWPVPWNGVQFAMILVVLLMINHLLSLYK
jgi:hypothetical protein